jgi:spermidine synthase
MSPATSGVLAWEELARTRIAGGDELVLRARAGVFEIRCNGWELMSNRAHHSESALARLGCARLVGAARLLIGGLGMGYTLRAALDVLDASARVVVAELLPEVVAWNRDTLAPLAGRPLADARVSVDCRDVAAVLGERRGGFDAVLLDVDNGPDAVMLPGNHKLYGAAGLALLRAALRPGGVLGVWSADRSAGFEAALTAGGWRWTATEVPARGGADDPRHTIYLGERSPTPR